MLIVLLLCWSVSTSKIKLPMWCVRGGDFSKPAEFAIHRSPLVHKRLFCTRTRRERTPKKKRHLSRSRSISAASVTSSSHRGKKGRTKKRPDLENRLLPCQLQHGMFAGRNPKERAQQKSGSSRRSRRRRRGRRRWDEL